MGIQEIFGYPTYVGYIKNTEKYQNFYKKYIDDGTYFNQQESWNCNIKSSVGKDIDFNDLWVDIIQNHVTTFVNSLNPKNLEGFNFTETWINIYDKFAYQEVHNHIGNDSCLSFSYTLHQPDNSGKFLFKNFNDWVDSIRWNEIFTGKTNRLSDICDPFLKEGEIVIFPSCMHHLVTHNQTDKKRITISGNIRIDSQKPNKPDYK